MVTQRLLLIFFMLLFPFAESFAQGKLKSWTEKNDSLKKQAFAEGRPWLSPIIAPAYTADAGFLVSGGMLYSFKVNKKDTVSQRSTLPATIFYSTQGNFGISTFLKTFWLEDKFRFDANLNIRDKDNNYYGKGFKQIDNTHLSDTTTLYHETNSSLEIDFVYKIKPSVFVGLTLKPGYASTKNFAPPVENDPYRSRFADKYFLNGIGGQFAYDTRDIVVNAWRGMYLNLSALFYDNTIGSKYDFQVYELDTRYYQTLNRPGNVLAFRFYIRSSYGDVPITELSDFSGGKNLRGYLLGHYRDNTTAFVLSEWRYTFKKRDNSLSKNGMVVWLGAGSIAPDVVSLTKWVPNGGVGYRLELQPRMNVCVDFGVGRDSKGVYFNFTEIF
ncbi:BamA/TamA family outer membrane protein [Prolixibacteraceae bacterium Z1-6]|uniref:BamA/TamA family outer membrane protein n=1 Tax=Draconibacterium aestuarii TaxID=2998507 RepID=A0A9X3J5W6_9BACT|nr:BamA/TamA family outer membrane protein [Prolixibacteraceae bacterium Z1-6]